MIDETLAARLRKNLEQRQTKPDNWAKLDLLEQLQWLVENTIQVLQPRPRFMRFRSQAKSRLEGPFFLDGPAGERIEAEQAALFERHRHEAIREVAERLAVEAASAEIRHEAAALVVLLDQAAQASETWKSRELISHVERLLGSISAKLLRPDANQSRRLKARLREGGKAENRRRAEEAAQRRASETELVEKHLRERPKATNSAIAGWIHQGGSSSLSHSSLRQLVGRVRWRMTQQT